MHSYLGGRNSLRETCAYRLFDPNNAGEIGPTVLILSRVCLTEGPGHRLQRPETINGTRLRWRATNAVLLQ